MSRDVNEVQQSHDALLAIWERAGCIGDFETWFSEQLIELPEVEENNTPTYHNHYDENGVYIYSTWR